MREDEMYNPEQFLEKDMHEIKRIVEEYPLATCVVNNGSVFEINHIPMIWQDEDLIGHIAMSNQMHKMCDDGCNAAFVFRAEDTYISPNWYPSKKDTHKQVPTWNYQVVHMHGQLYFHHDDKEKLAVVGLLTKHHEHKENGDKAWKMRDAPKDYMKMMLDNIVAMRFQIKKIEAKSKLSQNKEIVDYQAVIEIMRQKQLHGIASRMQKRNEP
jgi:transcriptional regulator